MHFKRHAFYQHDEIEMQAKYNMSMQQFIGGKYLLRLRAPLLTKLARGTFSASVEEHALSKYGVCIQEITYMYSFHMEPDEINSQKRWVKYTVLRELLLRIIHDKDQDHPVPNFGLAAIEEPNSNSFSVWDLSRRLECEHIPGEIMRQLQYAKTFELNQRQHLQHFVGISRQGMQVCLELTQLPMTLRCIIGDRRLMQEHGKRFIILLV